MVYQQKRYIIIAMGARYHLPETHHELEVITLESYVVPAHDVKLASSDEMDRLYGRVSRVPGSWRPSRIWRKPAEKHYTNQIREAGRWLAIYDDGYQSQTVGKLITSHLSPRIGYMMLRSAEVEYANNPEVTEDVSAALLFTALARYPECTHVHIGREVVLAELGNFTEQGESVGSVRGWLLKANPWLAEGENSPSRIHYPGAGELETT
jgi:hypothetical protein